MFKIGKAEKLGSNGPSGAILPAENPLVGVILAKSYDDLTLSQLADRLWPRKLVAALLARLRRRSPAHDHQIPAGFF